MRVLVDYLGGRWFLREQGNEQGVVVSNFEILNEALDEFCEAANVSVGKLDLEFSYSAERQIEKDKAAQEALKPDIREYLIALLISQARIYDMLCLVAKEAAGAEAVDAMIAYHESGKTYMPDPKITFGE